MPLGRASTFYALSDWRAGDVRLKHNYNTVINMSTTGSPTDWRVEKSNTSPHRVEGVLYEPKAFAIAPSFTNANAPFALPAMLGGAMSLFTPISLEAGGGARKIF